jgi:hypothetical protein
MSTKEKKITKEQLATIKEQQVTMTNKLRDIGIVENQKHVLLHEYAGLEQDMEAYKKELEKEYGAISVDLETGVYKEIENTEEKEK